MKCHYDFNIKKSENLNEKRLPINDWVKISNQIQCHYLMTEIVTILYAHTQWVYNRKKCKILYIVS